MARATKKQIAVIADQLGRATHYLEEIGRPFVLVIEVMDKVWTNTTERHAIEVLRDQVDLSDKIREQRVEDKAMKATAIPDEEPHER